VDNITHVIHYQLPDEIETYTHRSGRTGRANSQGTSMIIMTKGEIAKIRKLERIINAPISAEALPDVSDILTKKLQYLAQRIKATDVHPEIETYLPEVNQILAHFSKDELVQRLMSVEFTRLHSYYQKKSNAITPQASDGSGATAKAKDTRYTINIGARDDYGWKALKAFLTDFLSMNPGDIYHVDVMDNLSYFNTATDKKDIVLAAFEKFAMDGRAINVRITQKRGQHLDGNHSFGGRSRKGRAKGRGGDDFKRFSKKKKKRRGKR
jgi:ATP-dependent RNA helicase DeaD